MLGVRKKVDKVTSALQAWSDIIYCNAGMSLKVSSILKFCVYALLRYWNITNEL